MNTVTNGNMYKQATKKILNPSNTDCNIWEMCLLSNETEKALLERFFAVNLIEQVPPLFSLPRQFPRDISFLKPRELSENVLIFCIKLPSLVCSTTHCKQQGAFMYKKRISSKIEACDFENYSIAK
ncbi:hypothetical protein AVEN_76365-1 [Araneus ventricosus]|uniref:Uncharacterized protein n=1 Tax=Araneus ventricosus TaxID=182803 RepID=A0A4Y2KM07_ARAVE|nr:hypothetical protein AVEN_76365-1 [Araneus ventricosus]